MAKNNDLMSTENKLYFTKRLNIIEGQIRGLVGMIDNDRSYEEVLIQLGALTNSLKNVGQNILEEYMKSHFKSVNKKEIEEVINLLTKLV